MKARMSVERAAWLTGWLLRLRWKALWRERARALSALMLLVLGAWGLLWQPALFLTIRGLRDRVPEDGLEAFLSVGLGVIFGLIALIAWDQEPRSLRLRSLPLTTRERALARTLAALLDPEGMVVVLVFVLPPTVALAWVGVKSIPEGLLWIVGWLGLWVHAVAVRMLALRAVRLAFHRDPLGIGVTVGLLVWLLPLGWALARVALTLLTTAAPLDSIAREPLTPAWPPTWWALSLATDDWRGLAALLGGAGLTLGLASALDARLERLSPDRSGRRRVVPSAVARLLPTLPGVVGQIVGKELRALLHDRLTRGTVLASLPLPLLGLVAIALAVRKVDPSPALRDTILLAYATFSAWTMGSAKGNVFTFERRGLKRLLTLPISWRAVLVGLDAAQWAWTATIIAGLVGVAAWTLGSFEGGLRAWLVSALTLWGLLAVMHWVSVLAPFRISRIADLVHAPMVVGLTYLLLSALVVGPSIGLLAALPFPWELPGVALWNALVYGLSLAFAPALMGKREWASWV